MTEKACSECGAEKPTSEFRPQRRACRACERAKKRAWNAYNREHVREYDRARREVNPQAGREYSRRYRTEHADRISDRSREAYRDRSGPRQRQYSREYYAIHADARREYAKARASEINARRAESQSTTLERAVHAGKEWTGPELELVADLSRTARSVAEALGRTLYAVQRQRHLLRIDPRKSRLAGMPKEQS